MYDKYEASLRKAIFEGIVGLNSGAQSNPNPTSSSYNTLLLNELVRDYLRFQGYSNAASCLELESNLPKSSMSRKELAEELNVNDSLISPQVPLLFGLALKHRLQTNESHAASPIPEWKVLAAEKNKQILNPSTDMLEHFDEDGGFIFQIPK